MRIFKTVADVLKANINELIDKAEAPENVIKQAIIDIEDQIREETMALGRTIVGEKQALKEIEKARIASLDWENKARIALKEENEDLAKNALANKVLLDKNIVKMEASFNSLLMKIKEIRENIVLMKEKLQEVRNKEALHSLGINEKEINEELNKPIEEFGVTREEIAEEETSNTVATLLNKLREDIHN